MPTPFTRLEPAKQTKIINAALEEFAAYGFQHASTNRIVANAQIGKGMLFHYFKTKKDLYLYLADYAHTFMVEQTTAHLAHDEPDFIQRYKQAALAKLTILMEHPHISDFLMRVFTDETTPLSENMRRRLAEGQRAAYDLLFTNIDMSLFRPDVTTDYIYNIVQWVTEGYQNKLLHQLQGKPASLADMDTYRQEFDELLTVMQRILYKQEA